jgi:hypothetical protein
MIPLPILPSFTTPLAHGNSSIHLNFTPHSVTGDKAKPPERSNLNPNHQQQPTDYSPHHTPTPTPRLASPPSLPPIIASHLGCRPPQPRHATCDIGSKVTPDLVLPSVASCAAAAAPSNAPRPGGSLHDCLAHCICNVWLAGWLAGWACKPLPRSYSSECRGMSFSWREWAGVLCGMVGLFFWLVFVRCACVCVCVRVCVSLGS